ncbi:MAG: hypothetical protein J6S14_19975 [Clostridia bacterium]|nr:hypothetical protein [Clostridia bacterium]
MYRKVFELPEGARDFLRWSLFDGGPEYEGLDAEQQAVVDSCEYADDIPDGLLDYAFSGYDFVPEDFVPMAGDDWSLV